MNLINASEMKYSVITLIALFCFTIIVSGQEKKQKPRVLILTDIENEPDDAQSMVRFLTYSNMFDIEGLVATTSCWQRNKVADWRIHEIVDAYGKVRKDNGNPSLTRYQRVIITVIP